jgi:hypothetical protein
MSWQDYVDNQLIASQCVSKACIAGHDGGVWAKSEGFDVSIFGQRASEKKRSRNFNFTQLDLINSLEINETHCNFITLLILDHREDFFLSSLPRFLTRRLGVSIFINPPATGIFFITSYRSFGKP